MLWSSLRKNALNNNESGACLDEKMKIFDTIETQFRRIFFKD